MTDTEPTDAAPAAPRAPPKKKRFPWGMVVLFLVVGLGFFSCLGTFLAGRPPSVQPTTVLELDLEQMLVETAAADPLSLALEPRAPTLRDVVDALDRGARDPNVVGLVARVGAGGHGMGATQELRDAIARFRSAGRFAVAFSETFGEGMQGNGGYYLATAFQEVWLQPSGELNLVGLAGEEPFFKGALEKLAVEPVFSARGEYKTFKNQFTESKFTDAHKEALSRVLTSEQAQLVKGIAEGRGLDVATVEALLGDGPFSASAALAAKLIDKLGYRDEALARLDELAGARVKRLFARAYLERAGRPHDEGPTVALIYATGAVVRGAGGFDPLSGGRSLGADEVRRALRAASDDESVRAIVLRIDSPGGSYVASDAIRREVVRAREREKPVVASMGNVAGSGGYFIAMDADRIVAQPGTITGSIGVVAGKLVMTGLFEKLGITFDRVEMAPHAGIYSATRAFSDEERADWEASLDRIYADFVDKAAAGRKLARDDIEAVAKGRIWTGADALDKKLVDELGGLHEALLAARRLAGIDEKAPVTVRLYPREKEPAERLLELLQKESPENSDDVGAAAARVRLEGVRALARELRALGLGSTGHALEVPPELTHPGGL